MSDEPIKYVSVTALTGLLPLPWMEAYASKHAAECGVHTTWNEISENTFDENLHCPDLDALVNHAKGASRRYSKAARDRGTAIHSAVETFNLQTPEVRATMKWPLPVAASMRQYEHFVKTVKPRVEAAECKVYHRRQGLTGSRYQITIPSGALYAGTTDLICEIDGRMSILDVKTGKSVHEDAALQINAYAHADFLIADPNHPDAIQVTPARGRRWYEWRGKPEDEIPMPDIQAGYVLHLRDDGWALHEVPISDELYKMFLSLFSVERWERELKKTVLTKVSTGSASDEMEEAA